MNQSEFTEGFFNARESARSSHRDSCLKLLHTSIATSFESVVFRWRQNFNAVIPFISVAFFKVQSC